MAGTKKLYRWALSQVPLVFQQLLSTAPSEDLDLKITVDSPAEALDLWVLGLL